MLTVGHHRSVRTFVPIRSEVGYIPPSAALGGLAGAIVCDADCGISSGAHKAAPRGFHFMYYPQTSRSEEVAEANLGRAGQIDLRNRHHSEQRRRRVVIREAEHWRVRQVERRELELKLLALAQAERPDQAAVEERLRIAADVGAAQLGRP